MSRTRTETVKLDERCSVVLEEGRMKGVCLTDAAPAEFKGSALRSLQRKLKRYEPDLAVGTSFQQAVWRQLMAIPEGETRTYGEIAKAVGSPRAARAVGAACGANPFLLRVPCHRVVATKGLGGFALGLPLKERLLELEGAQGSFLV